MKIREIWYRGLCITIHGGEISPNDHQETIIYIKMNGTWIAGIASTVENALCTASQRQLVHIQLPSVDDFVVNQQTDWFIPESVRQYGVGLREYIDKNATSLRRIHIVVQNNPHILALMRCETFMPS